MSGIERLFQAAASEFAQARREPGSPHPAGELLVAYHQGELSGSAGERVQDHLAACRECTAILLDLGEVLPQSRKIPSRAMTVAAALALAVVALGARTATLQRAYSQLVRPQVNAPIYELFAGTVRGNPQKVKLDRDARMFTLVLHPPDPRPERTYGIEIARTGGAVIWQGSDSLDPQYGSVTLSVPLPMLGGARDLEIRLFDSATGNRSPAAAVYAVKIESP